ncbi:MAG: PP2C family protein-serine/threonine phosphatase [Pseudonocardiaceae bacterium]
MRSHDARVGDRYLLCSDGLHTVLSPAAIQHTLTTQAEPDSAVAELIALVRDAGPPDNVACIVADVLPATRSCRITPFKETTLRLNVTHATHAS